jgi:hypothetical protein
MRRNYHTVAGVQAMRAHLDVETTLGVVAKRDPPHISIRVGPLRLTMLPTEAVELATQIADAVENLRHAQPKEPL